MMRLHAFLMFLRLLDPDAIKMRKDFNVIEAMIENSLVKSRYWGVRR